MKRQMADNMIMSAYYLCCFRSLINIIISMRMFVTIMIMNTVFCAQ